MPIIKGTANSSGGVVGGNGEVGDLTVINKKITAIQQNVNTINEKLENEVITKTNLNDNLPHYNGEIE